MLLREIIDVCFLELYDVILKKTEAKKIILKTSILIFFGGGADVLMPAPDGCLSAAGVVRC